jgi:hypothetical protein
LIGLGVKGANLALNIAEQGFAIAVYNRTWATTEKFLAEAGLLAERIVAWRSSRFSRSSAFIFSAISVVTPARLPLSTCAFFTHSKSVCGTHPIFPAKETIAAHRDEWSPSWSNTTSPHGRVLQLKTCSLSCS